jgi:hypothetical protein
MTVKTFDSIKDFQTYITDNTINKDDIVHLQFESIHNNLIYLVHI